MKPARLLDDAGFRALLRAAAARKAPTAARDRFLIYLMGKTGLRISEALSLRVNDFWLDTSPPFLRVRTLKQRRHRGPDEILLDPYAARAARVYLARLPRPGYTEAALFLAQRGAAGAAGRPMTRFNARGVFRTYVRLAGLSPAITLHSLRHYRGTVLLRTTGDLEFTRQQMRHRDLAATSIYQHVDPTTRDRYLHKLAEAEP